MENQFFGQLVEAGKLTDREIEMLLAAGVRSAQQIYSYVSFFPSLSNQGMNVAKISSLAGRKVSPAYAAAATRTAASPRQRVFGALKPDGVPVAWSNSSSRSRSGPSVISSRPKSAIEVRPPNMRWPVRDQGQRGTCVAFATTACRELHANAVDAGELSEQYLFWAIKKHTKDPNPTSDGSELRYANEAVGSRGICLRSTWTYEPMAQPDISHHPPPASADSCAARYVLKGYHTEYLAQPSAVDDVLAELKAGCAVAASLAVFCDSVDSNRTNWNWLPAEENGEILNPNPQLVANGGHAVCIVGWAPSSREPEGGYFTFRNSWGTAWAHQSTEPGYGWLPASYVRDHLWEMLAFK